jgi:hypothetical protein
MEDRSIQVTTDTLGHLTARANTSFVHRLDGESSEQGHIKLQPSTTVAQPRNESMIGIPTYALD